MKAIELISIVRNTQNNDIVFGILVFSLLTICATKYLFTKNFVTLKNKTEYLSFTDDNTSIFSFIINFLMVLLVSILLVNHFNIQIVNYNFTFPLQLLVCFLIISGIMLVKMMIEMAYYRAFYNESSISYFLKTSSYINARNVLILLIFSGLYFYSSLDADIIMISWFALLCINRVWEIYFRYSNQITNNKSIWYYNILYLCTLEILPIMVLAKLLLFGKVI